jgi:hypothetical protein
MRADVTAACAPIDAVRANDSQAALSMKIVMMF